MKKACPERFALRTVVMVLVFLCVTSVGQVNAVERFLEGVHYQRVAEQSTKDPTVIEFFSYGCNFCRRLEPFVQGWLEQQDQASSVERLKFMRVPATWSRNFARYAQVFYLAEMLGVSHKLTPVIFEAIHDKGQRFRNEKAILNFFAANGHSEAEVKLLMASPELDARMNEAAAMFQRFQVREVPTFLVNGKYFTGIKPAGGPKSLFELIDFLLQRDAVSGS